MLRYTPTGSTVATSGGLIVTGLSTDVKPVSPLSDWVFFETDTGIIYIAVAAAWVKQNIKSGYTINVQALTSSPTDAQTIYFGQLPKAPTATAAQSKVYIRTAATIKTANIYCFSGTAGTAQAWSCYVRKNNTTDTLIQTLSISAGERIFTNSLLSIAMAADDYFEIKLINPTWVTNPLTTIFGGYVYLE